MNNFWTYTKDELPPKSGKFDRWGNPMSVRCLCAIVADTKQGRHFMVKEGYCVIYNSGAASWHVPGSENNVYAWMLLPPVPPAPEFKE